METELIGTGVELGQRGNTKTWPVCSPEYFFGFWVAQVRVSGCRVAAVLLCCCVRGSSALASEAGSTWLSLGRRSPGTGSAPFASRAWGSCRAVGISCFSQPSLVSGKWCIAFGFWPREDTGTQLVGLGGLIVPEIDPWRQG